MGSAGGTEIALISAEMKAVLTLVTAYLLSSFAYADVLISVAPRSIPAVSPRTACEIVHDGLNRVTIQDTECLIVDPKAMIDPKITKAKSEYRFQYHINLYELTYGYRVTVQAWNRQDMLEPAQSVFTILFDRNRKWIKFLSDLSANVMHYDKNKEAFKLDLLRNVLTDSSKLALDKEENFIEKATGRVISGKRAYEIYQTEGELQRNNLVYGIEIAAIFAYYSYRYYQNHVNQLDWDYGWVEGMEKKITGDAFRFDDNDRATNMGHVTAGQFFYTACRGNGFSASASFFCAALSSAFWEIVVEFKEVLSYNDLWTTIVGGSIQGETMFQAARMMRCGGTMVGRIFAAILSPFEEINFWLKKDINLNCPQKQGGSSISIGIVDSENGQFVPITLESEVLDVPVDQNGKVKVYIPKVFQAKMKVEYDFGTDGSYNSLYYLMQIAYGALYKHKIFDNGDGKTGYQIMVSAASAYERMDRYYVDPTEYEDGHFIGNVQIFGPRVQISGFYKGAEVRLVLEAYRDFALVKSLALNEYIDDNGREELRTVLEKHGYYYAYGWTGKSTLEARVGKVQAGAELNYNTFDSVEGYDRYRDKGIGRDINVKDKFKANRFYVRYNATKRVAVEASVEKFRWDGWMEGGYRKSENEKRYSGKIHYRF